MCQFTEINVNKTRHSNMNFKCNDALNKIRVVTT